MMASRRQGAWAGAVSTPRRPITLTHLRGQAACGLRGAALFPALCALYTPGAWSRLCACYPLRGPGDEVRAVAVLLEAFEEHDVVPIMDASTRAWVQEERAAWGEADGAVEDGDPDDGVPFWVHVIPLTNEATLYHCDPAAASTAELLLALLMADDMDEREEAAAAVTGRLAHLSGVTQTRVAAVLSCAAPVHRAMVDVVGGRLVDPLYDALCRDAAGVFRALPEPLSRIGTLCSYMAGSYDNPFLCPSDEMWEATGLENYAWSLDNVACCVAWWADARPVVTAARAVLEALKAPGALERLLPALTVALTHACQRAGCGYPPARAPADPLGTGDG